ncbi:MAG: diacylglycerol/polyprenol kinase family protein [Candidatus Hodarchaeales archaeon]|jgi:dolichol kinase
MGYITLLTPDLALVWNAIISVIVAMVYIQGIIILMGKLVDSEKLSSDLSRKVIHIAAGSIPWIWLFLDTSDGWSWILNIAVPFLFFLTFLLKGFKATPDDKDVKTMTRTGDPKELLKGPLYFTIVMMIAGTIFYGSYAGMLMLTIVGWGDGIAPYIGKKYGKRTYKTLGREKTLEGTIGVLLFSIVGSLIFYVLLGIVGDIIPGEPILASPGARVDVITIVVVIIILSIVATIVEALSPSDIDNLLIPASTLITLFIIDIFLLQSTFFAILPKLSL